MSFEIGQQVGGYEIIALLGKGGMGEVYHAKDTRLARTVAIKVLPRDTTADSEPKKRFLQEARTASALNHPNIVVLHDIANEGGRDYLVMEYVPGKSLDKLITRTAMSVQEAAGYAAQVASALTAAHAAGIVHRDIKPANLIVTPESQVKVLDFGLAKLMERRDGPDGETVTQQSMLTEAGTVMGTVAYMSPEQARGRPVDHRTDIFSLGVVLYEMLAGRRPFVSDSHVEVMNAVIKDAAPPLKNQPRELTDILDRALAKDPKDRYQHAGDLALDLRRFISRPAEVTLAAVPQLRNRKWWVAALVAAAVIALIVLAPWSRRSTADLSSNPLAGAQFTRFTDFEGLEYDAAISRDGRFVVFRSDHDGVVDTWVSQVGSGRFVNLTRGTRSSVLVPNAGFTADGSEIWLSAILGGDRLRLIPLLGGAARPFLTEHAMEPAWSPDGSKIVFHPYDTGDPLIITDKSGSNPQQIFTSGAGGHNHYPIWSLDGQWIYFISGLWDAREMDIWRIRPSGGKPEQLTNVASDVRYLAPIDDRTILYVSPDQNGAGPWLWALDTEKKQTRRISSGLEIYTSVHASADGRRLAVTVSNPTANMWSVPILDRIAEEKDVKPMSLPTVRAYAPRYGGSSLFYLSSRGGGDGLWRYVNGEATEIWRGADGALLEPPAVAFNGQRVAVILRKKGKRTLHIISSDGGDDRPLAPAIDVTSSANWSPDGKSIVVAGIDSGMPGLFNIPVDGGNPVRLVTGTASNPVWSPDGSVIAYTGPVVAVQGSLLIIRPDGTPLDTPRIQVRVNTEHYRFIPGTEQLVYIPTTSQTQPENFWLLDLTKKKTRQLANFESRPTRTFDITPDGKQIVFDRLRENSDIVLIDLPEKQR